MNITKQIFPKIQKFPIIHNLEGNLISSIKCEEIIDLEEFTTRIQCLCDQYQSYHTDSKNHTIIVFP